MIRNFCHCFFTAVLMVLFLSGLCTAAEQKQAAVEEKKPAVKTEQHIGDSMLKSAADQNKPAFTIAEDVGGSMIKEAARVKQEFKKRARTLFERKPLGWNWDTIKYLYNWLPNVPLKVPVFAKAVMEQGRVLGVAGSLIVLTFIIAILYSLLGQNRVLAKVEAAVQPIRARIPEASYPYFISALKVIVAALIPLILLGAFSLINAMITYQAAWFQLIGRLLVLWAVGALLISLLRESLTRDLFAATSGLALCAGRRGCFLVCRNISNSQRYSGAAAICHIHFDRVGSLSFVSQKTRFAIARSPASLSKLSGFHSIIRKILLSVDRIFFVSRAYMVSRLPAARIYPAEQDLDSRRGLSSDHVDLSFNPGMAAKMGSKTGCCRRNGAISFSIAADTAPLHDHHRQRADHSGHFRAVGPV
jgi:hypothetical protein